MKILSIIFTLIFGFVLQTQAATYTVTRSDDRDATCFSNVDCSLREAVKSANDSAENDVVNFVPNLSLITLGGNVIAIDNSVSASFGNLSIVGNGANVLTISGNNSSRIFYTRDANVTISGLTLTGGYIPRGYGSSSGAIFAYGGSLALNGVHVTGNTSGQAAGVTFYTGTHSITNTTFSANLVPVGSCGAFLNDSATLILVNSTISGNQAGLGAGGGFCSNGNTTLRNVTITNNSAEFGGGISQSGGTISLSNTVVAGNTARSGADIQYNSGLLESQGYNLIRTNSTVETTFPAGKPNVNHDIVGTSDLPVSAMLDALQNNGGTTPTHALLFGSPAINAGNNQNAPATDQRGFARIVNGVIDIGAYEFAGAPNPTPTPTPTPTACTFTLNPASQGFAAGAGQSGSFTFTASSEDCVYSVSSNDAFVTITNSGTGRGSSGVSYTVDANSGVARTGTITVGGQTFTVNQSGAVMRRKKMLLSPTN